MPNDTPTLPQCSPEQQCIIDNLKNNKNVYVDAVAGAGKTTTILSVAKHSPDKNILLLTYNARLKSETRHKIAYYQLHNITAHSFHSFGVKHYNPAAYNNLSLAIESPLQRKFNYNIFAIDEAQDLTYERFEFVCKIIKDNASDDPIQLCVLGDHMQCIYDFGDTPSDARFLTLANQIFSGMSVYPWVECKLSTSYRITQEMADFVNNCMLNDQRLFSAKGVGHSKPRYLICNAFNDVISEFNTYTNDLGYAPGDIFILAYSIRRKSVGHQSPIIQLENKLCADNVKVYASTSDDEVLNEDVIKNKLVLSTFHSTKGLERKVVIVFGFDMSFYTYFQKQANPHICPNVLYMSNTRGMEHLTVVHHYTNQYLPFLDTDQLELWCDVDEQTRLPISSKPQGGPPKKNQLNVTDVCKHMSPNALDELCGMLEIIEVQPPRVSPNTNIPHTIEIIHPDGQCLTEYVADITGDAIPIYLELVHTGQSKVLAQLKQSNISRVEQYVSGINVNLDPNLGDRLEENPADILKIATAQHCQKSGYRFKLEQLLKHDWVTTHDLTQFRQQFQNDNISERAEFEVPLKLTHRGTIHTHGYPLSGVADCVDLTTKTMWEFKCTTMIQSEHKIQLALYMYLHMHEPKYKNMLENFYIYNLITGQKLKLIFDKGSLDRMVFRLYDIKYHTSSQPTDQEFRSECNRRHTQVHREEARV